jgi:hypothetical protein
MPPELLARAKEHVALLVQHKREEHEQDKAHQYAVLAKLKGDQIRIEDAITTKRLELAAEIERANQLEKELGVPPTDDELLG